MVRLRNQAGVRSRRRLASYYVLNDEQSSLIQSARESLKLKQCNIADRLGLDYGLYSKFERGLRAISRDKILQVLEVLNIPQDLFNFNGCLTSKEQRIRVLVSGKKASPRVMAKQRRLEALGRTDEEWDALLEPILGVTYKKRSRSVGRCEARA